MPRLSLLLILALSLLLPSSVLAEPATWDKHSKRLELAPHVDHWLENERISFSEVTQLPDESWTAGGNESANFGYSNDVYWFRFRVTNVTGVEAVNFMEIGYPVLDHIEVYLPDAQEPLLLGDKRPFYDRPIHHRNFVVPLLLPAKKDKYR